MVIGWALVDCSHMKQSQAMSVMMEGSSTFLTGAPGSGKSFVLNRFVSAARTRGRNVAVTASTGIAATHIGGVTIHSWSGLGIRDSLTERDIETIASRDRLVRRFLGCDTLVIDEVSMLSADFLDMLDRLAKAIRDSNHPFGGLQVILVGDMFQLPPIGRSGTKPRFAFESQAWHDLDPTPLYLTEQHRQSGDELLWILNAMRDGGFSKEHHSVLASRLEVSAKPNQNITRLYSHNVDVDSINQRHLDALVAPMRRYSAKTRGGTAGVETLSKGVLAPAQLDLKEGAEVMFVANDTVRGYANGTLGNVVGFDGEWPIVELLANQRRITVEPHKWQLEEDGSVRAELTQVPLRLAWAITIHKSQGMSLDAAQVDLSRSFTPGMGYVALSRVRTLDGLYLLGINEMALVLNEEIFDVDRTLHNRSNIIAKRTPEYSDPAPLTPAEERQRSASDISLFEALKHWRKSRASLDGVPAYVVAHDATLEEIVRCLPENDAALLRVKGMGASKVAQYGAEIYQTVRDACGGGPEIPDPGLD